MLTAGDIQIELNGANITFRTPGDFKALSGGQDNAPGQGSGGTPVGLPAGKIMPLMPAAEVPTLQEVYDEQVVYQDAKSEAIEGYLPYKLNNTTTQQARRGKQPIKGETPRENTPEAQTLEYALRYSHFDPDSSV
ncbi:MAG: hypothetical protein IV085_07970 [Thiobacillus sp.]|nr:hypothetical protein [Thiobacillus sp.]